MRRNAALLCALLLFSVAAAAQTPMQKFLNSSFEPSQSVATQQLLGAGNYLLASADGFETYVIDSATGQPLRDLDGLSALLSQDAKNRTGFDSKLNSALSLDDRIIAAKKANEAKCMQYLGVDMHPCNDKQSCTVACFAVPQCSAGPLYSDGFLEAFMEWNAGRQRFDSLVSSYSEDLGAVATDSAAIDQKVASLNGLYALSKNLSANPIFLNRSDEGCSGGGTARCYEYCPKADYSIAAIDSGRQNLLSLKGSLQSVLSQPARAQAILDRSRANDEYLSTRGRDFAEFRLKMQTDLKKLNASAAKLSLTVEDPEVDSKLVSLSNFSLGIVSDAGAGFYRRALSKKADFESMKTEVSDLISSDTAKRGLLEVELQSIGSKISGGEWLLGNSSAADYKEELSSIESNASSSLTLVQLSELKTQADSLKERLENEIASKATGTAPNGTTGNQTGKQITIRLPTGLPCPPGVALLTLTLAAAFASGWKRSV